MMSSMLCLSMNIFIKISRVSFNDPVVPESDVDDPIELPKHDLPSLKRYKYINGNINVSSVDDPVVVDTVVDDHIELPKHNLPSLKRYAQPVPGKLYFSPVKTPVPVGTGMWTSLKRTSASNAIKYSVDSRPPLGYNSIIAISASMIFRGKPCLPLLISLEV